MLARVLEPEVMDSEAEARDYDTMDHGEVNRLFAANFLAHLDRLGLEQPSVLDVGAGTAQIPVTLCRQDPQVTVVAVDLASHMIELARRNVAAAGLSDRVRVQLSDAKGLPFADGSFAAVMSNSIVHHIPEPIAVLREAVRVARPGGLVFFRDLLRPASQEELSRLVDTYAAGANEHQRQMFADSLHAALALDEIRDLVASLGFSPDGVQQTSDRHWTWVARTP